MFDSPSYGRLTKKSQEWAVAMQQMAYYKKNVQEVFQRTSEDILQIKLIVAKENTYTLLKIFLEEVDNALENTEYKRHTEFGNLLKLTIEYNIDIILNRLVVDGEYGAIRKMKQIAGDLSDFYEGVEQAREILINEKKMTGRGNLVQRARFWKNVVWPNDELYNDTIELRIRAWGDLTPYWMLMEHGNFGSNGAFPQFQATNFFYTSLIRAKGLIEELTNAKMKYYEAVRELEEIKIEKKFTEKELNLIDNAHKRFLDNPGLFKPGEILDTFKNLESQRDYEIYVTRKNKIGTRLRR